MYENKLFVGKSFECQPAVLTGKEGSIPDLDARIIKHAMLLFNYTLSQFCMSVFNNKCKISFWRSRIDLDLLVGHCVAHSGNNVIMCRQFFICSHVNLRLGSQMSIL